MSPRLAPSATPAVGRPRCSALHSIGVSNGWITDDAAQTRMGEGPSRVGNHAVDGLRTEFQPEPGRQAVLVVIHQHVLQRADPEHGLLGRRHLAVDEFEELRRVGMPPPLLLPALPRRDRVEARARRAASNHPVCQLLRPPTAYRCARLSRGRVQRQRGRLRRTCTSCRPAAGPSASGPPRPAGWWPWSAGPIRAAALGQAPPPAAAARRTRCRRTAPGPSGAVHTTHRLAQDDPSRAAPRWTAREKEGIRGLQRCLLVHALLTSQRPSSLETLRALMFRVLLVLRSLRHRLSICDAASSSGPVPSHA